ncbi:MAG: hypothetical protein ACKOYM_00495, partial [Actinomycetes bacterium]
VFAVNGVNDSSKKTACKTEARTIKTAIQAFYAQEGIYPATASATSTNSAGTAVPFIGGFLEAAPENVTITYIDANTKPTLAWAAGPAKCSTVMSGIPV